MPEKFQRTTRAQFQLFTREVRRACDDLGVNDVRVTLSHDAGRRAYAEVSCDAINHTAHVAFCNEWEMDRPLTRDEIRRTARHEAMHIALAPLKEFGDSRFITKDEFIAALERTVRRLCRAKWGEANG